MAETESLAMRSPFSRLMDLAANTTGAIVNLHDVANVTIQVPDLHLRPEQYTHHGTYCRFAKFTDNNNVCAKNKIRSVQVAQGQEEAFWGCCPLGVWDLAQPLRYEGKLLAVLYLGHFQEKRELATVRGVSYPGPDLPTLTPVVLKNLRKTALLLEGSFQLIIADWYQRHGNLDFNRNRNFYRDATQRFIEARFTEKIDLQDLAQELNVHPHYLGKLITAIFQNSFKSLLRQRRIDEAKLLLCSTRRRITRVAYESGFQDSNYFSAVFMKSEGMTPKEYRYLKHPKSEAG